MKRVVGQISVLGAVSLLSLLIAVSCGGGSDGGESPGVAVISVAEIPGVVVPVRDAVPVTTAIDTEQYAGTISWAPGDNPFKATTVYTATVIVTPKPGFTLTGVAENFFTVAGAAATNAADSGAVTAVFPATGAVSDIEITFQSAVQTGGISGTTDTTGLTLSFSDDPATLTAENITVTGATKGALSGTGATRHLAITDITVANGSTVSVTVTSPAGYAISGSPRTAVVYRAPEVVEFQSAVQTGGVSGTTDSTGLTLSFSADPVTLTAENIMVTGATKGALSGTGTTRHLAITDITVANGGTVSVSMTSPPGYAIAGTPCDASVYRIGVVNMIIGMTYRGGKLAYIFQAGDPGFDANIPHGIIAAPEDQSAGVSWAIASCQSTAVPGGTTELFGDGISNTNAIIAQNGEGDSYAAGLARSYRGGDYTDWYLPSTAEMSKLYLNRAAIGGFRVEYYWVSSEESASRAWALYLDGGYKAQANKSDFLPVRAIRSF